jgi:hypothetical protein
MNPPTDKRGMRRNPVFWLMWLLPGAAVCASFATLAIALAGADRALPASYHWEGEALDADFERARRAAELGIVATLEMRGTQCIVTLPERATESPHLRLLLTHGMDAGRDRQVLLRRSRSGEYLALCAGLTAGKWRIALDDEQLGWGLRSSIDGPLARVELRARDPRGGAG